MRVEKYTFADGSNQFAVYVDGTRAIAGDEPWNMASNVDMYSGYAGASYEAVRQALSDAGATPGDTVHAFGYSQGGMITGLLATAGEFHVATHATIGSPTSPDLGAETTSVEIRHTDDLVAGLAGGGRMDGTGSPDSIVVTREAAPGLQAHDLGAGAHGREHYHETVRLLEESEDPRAHALDALWAELATAKNVEVTESHARIIEPTWDAIDVSGDGEPPATGASSSAGAGSPRTPH